MKPIVITAGDPAGIGPEIVAKLFRDHAEEMSGCFVVGDVDVLRRAAACLGTPALPVALLDSVADALAVPPRCLPVLAVVQARGLVTWGEISAEAGRQAADAVVWAARAALRGDVAAVVTAPLHKESLSAAGVAFPGHTELLQAEAAAHVGCAIDAMPVRMMLANNELRTVLVSIHMSLRRALDAVTFDNVLETLRISHESLSRLLGRAPRLAVAGLNPHAGEGGLFGTEEIDTIIPAIEAARTAGIDAFGPFPPDTVFMRARALHGRPDGFDAVVAMYHDQGLIPVKYLGIEDGVNVTLGLPLVRTSPDHGTAFDLAGTGRADASSLLAAVRTARLLAG